MPLTTFSFLLMYSVYPKEIPDRNLTVRMLKRRECLPRIQGLLWQIDEGMVRTIAISDSGTLTTLGIWGKGEIIGQPLSPIEAYQVECLCDVSMHRIQIDDPLVMASWVWANLRQSQALLMMQQGSTKMRLQQLIVWLADRFGNSSKTGDWISHSLSHQDIGETIGATRVTVTRALKQLEQEGIIQWSRQKFLVRQDLICK